MIVEVPFRLQHPKPRAQNVCHRFLRGRLARRSRDRDQRFPPQPPHGRGQSLQCNQGVRHRQQPCLARIPPHLILAHDCGSGPLLEGLFHIVVPIQALALHRKEKLTRSHCPRINRISVHGFLGSKLPGSGNKLRNLGQREPHPLAPPRAAWHSYPAARNTSRATSKSSNGAAPSRITCTFSCPFPVSSTRSPGRASRIASPIAFRRSTSTLYFTPVFCSPTTASLIMARGSSPRGLSEVSTTKSLPRPAASPISGRFFLSRSPPHPNTVNTLPFVPAAETSSLASAVRFRKASSVCA